MPRRNVVGKINYLVEKWNEIWCPNEVPSHIGERHWNRKSPFSEIKKIKACTTLSPQGDNMKKL